MSEIEARFAGHGFVRVHRQYLANLAGATDLHMGVKGTAVIRFDNDEEIPVARRRVAELRRRLRI